MAVERTLCIVKPDAVEKHKAGAILARIEAGGFHVVALRMRHLTRTEAEGFYEIHRARPFFGELVQFMTRSPLVIAVLERDSAVTAWRDLMGATDPAKAADGTIRKAFAKSISENSVHGSDAADTAQKEIAQFFSGKEIVG